MPLTDVQVRKVKPADKPFKLVDAGGLHLYVTPAGGRLWRYRYSFGGKEKLLSLGAYPEVSIADARMARDAAKAELRAGRDPSVIKRQKKATADRHSSETFEAIAREWHALRRRVGRSSTPPTSCSASSTTFSRRLVERRFARSARPRS